MVIERPILFSGPMVRALLAGEKTVTRRIIRGWQRWEFIGASCDDINDPQNWGEWCEIRGEGREAYVGPGRTRIHHGFGGGDYEPIPAYAEPGDTLWVRETWREVFLNGVRVTQYRADEWPSCGIQWRPSIFMPRAACRLRLRVVSVRPERLHEITPEDIAAEGVDTRAAFYRANGVPVGAIEAGMERARFAELWDAINGKRAPWASNPWVWRVAFEVIR